MSEGMSDDLVQMIKDHEKRISALEGLFKQKAGVVPTRISLSEFLNERKVGTDVDRVLAIAYYLEFIEGLTSLNIDDFRAGFRRAAATIPANLSETVRKNIAKGYLMNIGEKKNGSTAWILTGSGKTYVESNLRKRAL